MNRRLAWFLGVAAMTAAFAASGASAARAAPYGCISGSIDTYAYATCFGSGSFSVGVKCLKPGNVYYWNRSGWYRASEGKKTVHCSAGHVAKGHNVWLTD
jgi:hypothetical protein